MAPISWAAWLAVAMAVALLATMELGYRLGRRARRRDPEHAHEGTGAVEAAVYGLLGLLLAFSYGSAGARFETRRAQVVAEANAIGTAWLRLDLLPEPEQPPLRASFRAYVDARLAAYEAVRRSDFDAAARHAGAAAARQGELWARAVAASRGEGQAGTRLLLLPALNEAFDIATARTRALSTHAPVLLSGFLVLVAVMAALPAGYTMAVRRSRSLVHMALFVVLLSLTLYVTFDFEYPRLGLIRIDAADQALVDVRRSMD